jgi:hypothetical protein
MNVTFRSFRKTVFLSGKAKGITYVNDNKVRELIGVKCYVFIAEYHRGRL